jgi:membrane-associated phospholipid phosphatase
MYLQSLNRSLFLSVNRFAVRTPHLHGLFLFFANQGLVLFALVLLAAYLIAWNRRSLSDIATVMVTVIAALVAVGINQPLAHSVKELRPYDTMSHILVLIHRANDYSFPSDHGVMIGAVTAGVFFISPIVGLVSLILGLVVAFARVYTAAHYPFDLLAGIGVGAMVTLLCTALLWRPCLWTLGQLERTPLRILLYRGKFKPADQDLLITK